MVLTIPDDLLEKAQQSEHEIPVELACRWFDAGKLTLRQAGRLAGLERLDMEEELSKRQLPVFRPTIEDLHSDLRTLEEVRGLSGDHRE